MLGDLILGLPILCLLISILYCSVRLWKSYEESIYFQVSQIIKKFGIWKTGMGRWRSLALSSCLYFVSAIVSIIVPVLYSLSKSINLGFIWSRDPREYFAAVSFALITIIISLSMYGIDISKAKRRISHFLRKVLIFILPVIIWVFFGISIYKDFLFEGNSEWFSTGNMFQLSWGIVSFCLMAITVYKSYKDLWG